MGLSNYTSNPGNTPSGGGPGVPGGGMPGGFPGGPSSAPSSNGTDDAALAMLVNFNERFKTAAPARFRDATIEQLTAVLIGATKPNGLLVGPAGVGKTKIAEDIARRIALGDPVIPDQLRDHTIYELPLSNLVAGASYVGMLEANVQAVVDFASDPKNKAILFIDEVHQLTTGNDGGTYSKIAQILKPAMARGDMQVIAATTTQEARTLDDDPAFKRRFTRLIVDELTSEQTLEVLNTVRPKFIDHYTNMITVDDDVLATVIQIANENSASGSHRPDNAITLLDRAMADRLLKHKHLISQAILDNDTQTVQMLQAWPNVPLTKENVKSMATRMLTGNSQEHVFDVSVMLAEMKTRLQGQDKVLDKLAERISREELALFPRTTPLAWLFAGASGVGKTETAKIVAEQMTGQEPIILNMTEYHHESAMARIIGAPAGYIGSDSNAELPFDSLESNPRRVILLDEFEKADKAVQRLFMQALDEGYLTMSRGRKVDFSKAVVIATTNAARESLEDRQIGFGTGAPQTVSYHTLTKALANHFDAELLGRFSLIVGYSAIDENTYSQIVAADYVAQRARIIDRAPRYATFLPDVMPDAEIRTIRQNTFNASHGARPAKRAVRAWIEDLLIASQKPVTHSLSTTASVALVEEDAQHPQS